MQMVRVASKSLFIVFFLICACLSSCIAFKKDKSTVSPPCIVDYNTLTIYGYDQPINDPEKYDFNFPLLPYDTVIGSLLRKDEKVNYFHPSNRNYSDFLEYAVEDCKDYQDAYSDLGIYLAEKYNVVIYDSLVVEHHYKLQPTDTLKPLQEASGDFRSLLRTFDIDQSFFSNAWDVQTASLNAAFTHRDSIGIKRKYSVFKNSKLWNIYSMAQFDLYQYSKDLGDQGAFVEYDYVTLKKSSLKNNYVYETSYIKNFGIDEYKKYLRSSFGIELTLLKMDTLAAQVIRRIE